MIPFNFIYYRPDSLQEAADIYSTLQSKGQKAVYFAGGSEIITMCRTGSIQPKAVIDIKNIPECGLLSLYNQKLQIGSVCTLNQISESKLFPLMRLACGRIADHTNQCRITLGGNLCGSIIYRETSLPLLLADAEITLYGPEGERTVPLRSVFYQCMQLKPGEMIVQVQIPVWALSARHYHIKKTANEKIDYPLVSVAAICKDSKLRLAFSGICSYPFRSEQMESALNQQTKSFEERVKQAAELLPEPVYADAEGSGEYRLFVFKNTLRQLLEDWDNGKI
ncbi:MAG: FAD binding domain-containing protein [Clostridia bacterium]|mgnify:CR=1 FL=1|nr:FAD binding domain-containing protein [Clostridia bacterium]MDD4798642.1 FAD binding domain-containing protein [Clostridia bacterium]